jgi:hypothetical protein
MKSKIKMGNPKCFLSYSWDSIEHKEWVRKLACELQRNGVETYLDQWDTYPGIDLTKYFETSIRESDFVLLICTPLFAKKANAGSGGVGYEKAIVTGEIFEEIASPKKFVPILRAGSHQESLPSFLKSRFALDFRNDHEFQLQIESLLRHIHQAPKYPRPPLGSKPIFPEKPDCGALIVPCTPKKSSFDIFKDVYSFAYSGSGMNLLRDAAKEFATNWMEQFADKDFEKFKSVFLFAYSGSGMNLLRDAAKEFATNEIKKGT